MPDTIAEIEASGAITAQDVLALRQNMFRDGIVDEREAAIIFHLDQHCIDKAPVWKEFYVDSLTDYFVWKSDPAKYVSEEQAKFLLDHIAHDEKVDGLTELELLTNIAHWAISCPEPLIAQLLAAVKESVLKPEEAHFGQNRKPGVITATDVYIIRRAIYGDGSGGGFTVTRREADLIFDLNNETVAAENYEGWWDLFVKAIANHLMYPRGASPIVPPEEIKRREAWLEERRGVGRLLMEVGRNVATFNIAEGWRAMDLFGAGDAAEQKAREDARIKEAFERESIDESEARWLLSRIAEDDIVHENERALLTFIRGNATNVHPLLTEFFTNTGL